LLDLKPAPPDLKLRALSGPRDLKTPGSLEWIIQTTHRAQGIWLSLNDDTKAWSDIVAELDGQEVWSKYPPEKPYGTRNAFYRAELGAAEPELTRAKEDQQLQKKGGQIPHSKSEGSSNARPLGKRCDSTYIRSRLERDSQDGQRPKREREQKAELLAQIERGEISAHKAAIQADYRQRMIQIAPNVNGFLRAANKHLSTGERRELKSKLERPQP
jgi:hypothetical protein